MYILYIIFIIFLIILYFKKYFKKKERYDGRVLNIQKIEDCADISSSIYGVSAFAYDDIDKKCYISKTPLTKPPLQSHPYHNSYKDSDIVCNKHNFILNSRYTNDKNNLILNRLYSCYYDLKNEEILYFSKNDKLKKININDISQLNNNPDQIFFEIIYPTEKNELKDITVTYENNKIKNIKYL